LDTTPTRCFSRSTTGTPVTWQYNQQYRDARSKGNKSSGARVATQLRTNYYCCTQAVSARDRGTTKCTPKNKKDLPLSHDMCQLTSQLPGQTAIPLICRRSQGSLRWLFGKFCPGGPRGRQQ
jgi:DNA-directed RNA polymerase subunit N (RpoN/RPB10)